MSIKNSSGFTIVELLIVVVVIAILAAITIVSYNGIQNRAYDAAVKSDLEMFAKKLELVKSNNTSEVYPLANTANMTTVTSDEGIKFSTGSYSAGVSNNLLYCRSSDGKEAALVAVSKSKNQFSYNIQKGGMDTYSPAWTSSSPTTCNTALSDSTSSTATWAYNSGSWRFGI